MAFQISLFRNVENLFILWEEWRNAYVILSTLHLSVITYCQTDENLVLTVIIV